MKLTIAEPKYLKESVSIISDLVNEANFKVTKEGIELVAMDPANVAMVVFKLFSSAFTEYKVDKEQNLAINLNNLKQILRRAGPNDMVSIEVQDDAKLKVQLRGNSTRTFSLPIIDLEEKAQKVPELEFPVQVETEAATFTEAIEDADIVAESVSFVADGGAFRVDAEGDLSNASIELKDGKKTKVTSKQKGTIRAKYSVEYLKKMIQGSKVSESVKIQFNKDYPVKLDYHTIDKVMLSFILAPRVEND
ncbi:proliferating cell nuclear antigen (pcna) [Candidatus Woesearchaeota archaeon]|nr:proliferating cell nuclear antigen (pcna) [Candidatus Woesearchaeota archaeon]